MYIAFLWHMHQPFYKDIFKNKYLMPWTFLHAIKDYYDMIKLVEEFEHIQITFNLVPSLIEQIQDYSNSLECDNFINLLKKEVNALSREEKNILLRQLFYANYEKMISPLKRFRKLYEKKENYKNDRYLLNYFSNEDILDLEVLYLLSWCGFYIKKESQLVKELIEKGQNFTEKEKNNLLEELRCFINKILPLYKKNLKNGRIEISTTPYFHPILPLLIDFNVANISSPEVVLPKIKNFFFEDAEKQVTLAIKKFNEVFEDFPSGFWPAEGAVSKSAVELLKKYNIEWIATDEDILFKSKKNLKKEELYQPFEFNGIKIFFRDKDLSNLIGFRYSKWGYDDAAKDLYNRLKDIEKMVPENAIVSIILDGENAWEFYDENGIPFLKTLYNLIDRDDSLNFTTFDNYLKNNSSKESLDKLYPGSWINSNFNIWIGHPEENKAWELIDKTKQFILEKKNLLKNNEDKINLANREILIAEGSDWFWWYGDDFYSEVSDQFDMLFRTHLANVYILFDEDIPLDILQPIKKEVIKLQLIEPNDLITPIIDGKISSYFEWVGSGFYNFNSLGSTMHFGKGLIKKFFYGFDEKNFYLRLDCYGNVKDILKDCILEINIHNYSFYKIQFFINENKIVFEIKENGTEKILKKDNKLKGVAGKIFELCIPFECIDIKWGEEIEIVFEIVKNSELLERIPQNTPIKIKIPENIFLEYWKV